MMASKWNNKPDNISLVFQRIINTYKESKQEIHDYKGSEISVSYIENYYFISYPRFYLVYSLVSSYLSQGSSILEVGPGYGFILLSLKDAGYTVKGAELDVNIPAYSRTLIHEGVPLYPLNIEQDVISDEIQGNDLIIASEVLEHLHTSLIVSVGRIATMCKNGGLILITVPNIYRLENYLKIFFRENICEDFPSNSHSDIAQQVDLRTHPREPTMKDLVRAVEGNHLEIVRKGYFSSSLMAKYPILAKLIPPPLREHLFVLAKKP